MYVHECSTALFEVKCITLLSVWQRLACAHCRALHPFARSTLCKHAQLLLNTCAWLAVVNALFVADADLLQALTPALLPAILAAQDAPSLDCLAALQGQQPEDLMQQQFGAVFGALYPCMAVPEEVSMAQDALGGGLMSGYMEPGQQVGFGRVPDGLYKARDPVCCG